MEEIKIPAELKHRPVIVCSNYSKIDGRQSTGAAYLSLGLAQLIGRGKADISAKIWRQSGQSEELPLHRALDLAILICRACAHFREAYRYDGLYDKENPVIDRIALQGDAMTVSVCTGNEHIAEDIKLFRDALCADDELLGERFSALARLLGEMGYNGR